MTRASVVVPSHAGARRLPRLLDALAAQTFTDVEVIVVLDGDIDASASALADHAFPARVIELPENRGRAAALNAGFAAATGEILIRCDDDLEPGPEWAAAHVRRHSGPTVGVVGFCADVVPDGAYARAYGDRRTDRLRAMTSQMSGTEGAWRLWGANVSVDRSTWERVGPYDTRFRAYGWEDVEWGYRLHLAGIPIVLEPAAEARHLAASTDVATRAARAFDAGAARQTFEAKHGRGSSGPAAPTGGAWARAVSAAGRHLDRDRTSRLGRLVDRALPRVPADIGEKLAAFVVESASVGGFATTGEHGRRTGRERTNEPS